MVSKEKFTTDCINLFAWCPGNQIEIHCTGDVDLFDLPMIGFESAADPLFEKYKEKGIVGPMFFKPEEWMSGAKTVVSMFFPFTATVRDSNRETLGRPSTEWLYGRIEGQQFLNGYMARLQRQLEEAGIRACVPSIDARFKLRIEPEWGDFRADSRWSERHTAYACGLGTFSLTRGLITEKGMAGRFASIILDAEFEPDERPYTGIYDYCIRCGACAAKCPAKAISLKHGKNNLKCRLYLNKTKRKYSPRYGCGKCQVGVPCECRAPGLATLG